MKLTLKFEPQVNDLLMLADLIGKLEKLVPDRRAAENLTRQIEYRLRRLRRVELD